MKFCTSDFGNKIKQLKLKDISDAMVNRFDSA